MSPPTCLQVVLEEWHATTQAGYFEGAGSVTFKNGAVYVGEWSSGQMHGTGKMTFPDGIVYEGDFNKNEIVGNGVSGARSLGRLLTLLHNTIIYCSSLSII